MVLLTAPTPWWKDVVPVPLDDGVAFVRTSPAGHADIYDVAADGSTISRLTTEGRVHDPAPVPGSQLLAYVSDGDIRVLNRHTGERRRLTNSPTQYKAGLAVSPDGTQIAFTRIDPGRLEQIFVMDLDGTHVRRVSRGDFYDFLPRWSPDGTRLAFTSLRDGTSGVYTMRVDGRDVVDVSRTPASLAMRPGVSVLHVTETLWAWR
jgi:Tol biopolymer transport system component